MAPRNLIRATAAGVAALSSFPASAQTAATAEPGTLVSLKAIAIKSGEMRLGYGLEGKVPEAAFRALIGRKPVHFHDLDGDGEIRPDSDGMSIPGHPFVVPLPPTLLVEAGQFDLEFEGTKGVRLRPCQLALPPQVVADAAFFTELRIRAGLRPVQLDTLLCSACSKHCSYLAQNGINDGSAGMGTHDEDPTKPGYTEEGARAGKGSSIGFDESIREALFGSYCTAWHGAPMLEVGLRTFGVAAEHGVSLVYFGHREVVEKKLPQLFPPDGARSVPRTFARAGEEPNPVPGTEFARECGFPIYVLDAAQLGELRDAVIEDARHKRIAGSISCAKRPSNPAWPTNSGLALFIPAKPLAANTTFHVRFEFASGPVSWSFRTGD